MNCLRLLTSLTSLMFITQCTLVNAQNQGLTRSNASPQFISRQQGSSNQFSNRQTFRSDKLSESECIDKSVASLCNDWKSDFGCTHLSVITYCRKTCGFCQSQGNQQLGSQPPINQFSGNQQLNILSPVIQPPGTRVISLQPQLTQPTLVQNPGGHLIISHTPGGQDTSNNLPIGPAGTPQQPTSRPLLTSPPAAPVTSNPAPIGDRNFAISLFDGVTPNIPPVPVAQDIEPSTIPTTSDMITNTETELPFHPTIPDSWKGDKSQLAYGHSPLTLAARNGIIEEVAEHIQNGFDINHQDQYGVSALMWAAGQENFGILDFLLQAGASTNLLDSSGSTALMYAAFNNNEQAVKKLLDGGAEIDVKDSFGETALMGAARNSHFVTVEVLLKDNAQVDLQDNKGMTALHYAALKQCVQCVESLIRKCPDITLKNNVGKLHSLDHFSPDKTPLTIAKEKGNGKIITLIEGLIQPSCVHDGSTFLAGHLRVESCIELECKCGGYYEATGNADLSCLAPRGIF